MRTLVLWDIDRTLIYVGEVDRQLYRDVFAEVVGHPPAVLPPRGSGVTTPRAMRWMLEHSGVDGPAAEALLVRIVELLPQRLGARSDSLLQEGVVLPGARAALEAVWDRTDLVPTVVTGNLKASALLKLSLFDLDRYLHVDLGGYSSDDPYRPHLVGIAQRRAGEQTEAVFTSENTVVIGDSLEDVSTATRGGAAVVAVASGTTSADDLRAAGADAVLDDLCDSRALLDAIDAVSAPGRR